MKKILFFIFICFSSMLFSQQKFSGTIFYNVSLKPNDVSKKGINNKISETDKQTVNTIIKNSSDVEFSLNFTKNEAVYKIIDKMESDADNKINLTKVIAGGNNLYYSNNTTNTYLYQKEDGGELFLINYQPENLIRNGFKEFFS